MIVVYGYKADGSRVEICSIDSDKRFVTFLFQKEAGLWPQSEQMTCYLVITRFPREPERFQIHDDVVRLEIEVDGTIEQTVLPKAKM